MTRQADWFLNAEEGLSTGRLAVPSRYIRVRARNGEDYAAQLVRAGYAARWLGPGTAYTSLSHGCGDPSCCPPHSAHYTPQAWGCVETDASGAQARRIWRGVEYCVVETERISSGVVRYRAVQITRHGVSSWPDAYPLDAVTGLTRRELAALDVSATDDGERARWVGSPGVRGRRVIAKYFRAAGRSVRLD